MTSEYYVDDTRDESSFTRCTFTGYSKSQVTRQLLKCIQNSEIEAACYWGAELVCAGHWCDLWDVFFVFFSRHIHLEHCAVAKFLNECIAKFRAEMYTTIHEPVLNLRNSTRMREIVVKIVIVLCLSRRRLPSSVAVVPASDIDLQFIRTKFQAPDITFAEMNKDDPKELFPFLNELSFQLTKKDVLFSVYWIEWMLAFAKLCVKNKRPIVCHPRDGVKTTSHQTHVIWVIWETILVRSLDVCVEKQQAIRNIYDLFRLKFAPSCINRRRELIYYAVSLLCESCTPEKDCVLKHDVALKRTAEFVHLSYQQIKQNNNPQHIDSSTNTNYCPVKEKFFRIINSDAPRTSY